METLIIAIAFPVMLFLLKHVLPPFAVTAIKRIEFDSSKIWEEAIRFPPDMMFIAASCGVTKILEVVKQSEEIGGITKYIGISILAVFITPFAVFLSEMCINIKSEGKYLRCILFTAICYLFSFWLICCSIS